MIDDDTKAKALLLLKEGVPLSTVAKNYGLSRRTIQYWLHPRPKSASKKRVGAPSKLSRWQCKWVKEILVSKKYSSKDVCRRVFKNSGGKVQILRRTVQRIAKKGR